jgi:hydrogenase maturation protease
MISKKPVLVLGIGNPILSDDAIGILVARAIADRKSVHVDIEEVSASGIEVMELMLDRNKVIIVDAIMLPGRNPGDIIRLKEEDFEKSIHGSSPHGINLSTAIALGRQVSADRMPREIVFFAMQAEDVSTFGEKLSSGVSKNLAGLIRLVEEEISSAA